jgi:aspartyl-tRNA(Asn)/glutamyl-tRNA(Gln) amidotransferase subunit C
MTNISHKEVEHVAQLTEQEKTLFGEQLSQILTFVGQLQEVSTEGIPPTASVADQESVLREDLPREGLSQEQALSNAPEAHHGFFVVPKILGKK